MNVLEMLKSRARAVPQHIVLPEGEDPRVITAAARVAAEGFAKLTLLGRPNVIQAAAAKAGVSLGSVTLLDPGASANLDRYAQIYFERRRARGTTLDEARTTATLTSIIPTMDTLTDPLQYDQPEHAKTDPG